MVLAQMMPGMEYLGMMVIFTVTFFFFSLLALFLRSFRPTQIAGFIFAVLTIVGSVTQTTLVAITLGSGIRDIAYWFQLAPAFVGIISIIVRRQPVRQSAGFEVITGSEL